MGVAYRRSAALSITLFFYYGMSCLFSQGMVAEFERFRLSRFRRLTGALEVLGALGLLAGFILLWVGLLAAAGLSMLMTPSQSGITDTRTRMGPLLRSQRGRMSTHKRVSGALSTFASNGRKVMELAADKDDEVTVDIFTEVTRGAEKMLWFVESHLQG